MTDLLPVPGRPDLQWRAAFAIAGRTLSIDLWGVADTPERADTTSFAPGVRLRARLRPVARLSIPRHVHCPGDPPSPARGPVPLERWLPRALRWQDRPVMTARRRALLGPLAARAGAPCRLRIEGGVATLQVRTPEGWRTDRGDLGALAWSLCDLLGIRHGHTWSTEYALPEHAPVFVPLAPAPDDALRAWLADGRNLPDRRRDSLRNILDHAKEPLLRRDEEDAPRIAWEAEAGDGWIVREIARASRTRDMLLLREAQAYGRAGTRLGPVRRLAPLARISIDTRTEQDPERRRAAALATARAVAGPGGDARTRALEALLPAGTVLARRIHLPLPPDTWRHGDADPGLPPAAAAAVQGLLERAWNDRRAPPACTPAFSPTGFHDGMAQPIAWSGAWSAPKDITAHARLEALRHAPKDLAALGG